MTTLNVHPISSQIRVSNISKRQAESSSQMLRNLQDVQKSMDDLVLLLANNAIHLHGSGVWKDEEVTWHIGCPLYVVVQGTYPFNAFVILDEVECVARLTNRIDYSPITLSFILLVYKVITSDDSIALF